MATPNLRIFNPSGYNDPGYEGEQVPMFRVLLSVNTYANNIMFPNNNTMGSELRAQFGNALKRRQDVKLHISHLVKELSWSSDDDSFYTTVNLSLDNFRGTFNLVPAGSRVFIQVRRPFYNVSGTNHGKWYPYITCYLMDRSRSASGDDETMEWTLYDRMFWLQNNEVHKVYKAGGARRRRGWTATDIIKDMAKDLQIPVGVIHPSSALIKRNEVKGNAIEEMRRLLAADKRLSKRKTDYYIHMRDGKLNVVKEFTPKSAWFLSEHNIIENGQLSEVMSEDFATRLTVTGTQKRFVRNSKGGWSKKTEKKKYTVNPIDPNVQRAFGIIHKKENVKGEYTQAELITLAREKLAKYLTPEKEFTVTMRGIPYLWPGSKVYISSKYFGVNGLVKVKGVDYTYNGDGFTMSLNLNLLTRNLLTGSETRMKYKKTPYTRY